MLLRELQPLKASLSIEVTLPGMIMSLRPVQPLKANPIELIPSGIVIVVKAEQRLKILPSKELIFSGITKLVSAVQSSNAFL